MKKIKIFILILLCWAFLLIMSISWIAFIIFNHVKIVFSDFMFMIVLIIASVSFFIALISIFKILKGVKSEIKNINQKEKNVKDVYLYDQIAEPPSMYN
jgi:TRAP-type C4-dicarboxylate transport system permease small subunit